MRGVTPDRSLAPGETLELGARLPAPPESGRYGLVVDLVDEGVVRFGDMGSPFLETGIEFTQR